MSVYKVKFNIPFVAGKERSRVRRAGTHVFQYTPERTRANLTAIGNIFRQVVEDDKLKAVKHLPVSIEITVQSHIPKSRPKKITSESNTFKPDVDNIAKLVMDGLNGIAYEDDKQVTSLSVTKLDRIRPQDQDFEYMEVVVTYGN